MDGKVTDALKSVAKYGEDQQPLKSVKLKVKFKDSKTKAIKLKKKY